MRLRSRISPGLFDLLKNSVVATLRNYCHKNNACELTQALSKETWHLWKTVN